MSTMYSGKVIDGRVVVEGELPEGAEVTVLVRDDREVVELTSEEEAELEAAMDEADRGEVVDGDTVLQRLRNGEYGRTPLSRNSPR